MAEDWKGKALEQPSEGYGSKIPTSLSALISVCEMMVEKLY